ncbi:hypothetical protein ACLB2K_002653 [Fragaria x ananassa]
MGVMNWVRVIPVGTQITTSLLSSQFSRAFSLAYDTVCRKFVRTMPVVVVSVNYRSSSKHGYPSQYDDGLDVLKFLDQTPMPSPTSPTSLAASSPEIALAPTSKILFVLSGRFSPEEEAPGTGLGAIGWNQHYPVDYRFVLRSSTASCHVPSISAVHHSFLPSLPTTVV